MPLPEAVLLAFIGIPQLIYLPQLLGTGNCLPSQRSQWSSRNFSIPPLRRKVLSNPFSAKSQVALTPARSSFMYKIIIFSGLFLKWKISGIILSLPMLGAGQLIASLMRHSSYYSGSLRSSRRKVVYAVIPNISVAQVTAEA